MSHECLHFRETVPQPEVAARNKHHRWWECIDCGEVALLKATVHEWVRQSYGKWQCKKKGR